ncbi:hypothetical protein QZH41_014232 [Actinostola sp. cb2023]|nr:hypothetical protein QZH41_014232 [Actinostola sp. cb2023]
MDCNATLVRNASNNDLKITEITCEWIASIGAGIFYVVLFVLILLSRCCWPSSTSSSCFSYRPEATKIVFLVGAIILPLNVFTNAIDTAEDKELERKLWFRIVVDVLMGIVVLLSGLSIFKKTPRLNCTYECHAQAERCTVPEHQNDNVKKLRQQIPMMFICFVTFLILIMEATFLGITHNKSHHNQKVLITVDKCIFLIQKGFQAITYYVICNILCLDTSCENYSMKIRQAQFYFKVMSIYNAVLWLDSLVNVEADLVLAKVEEDASPWVSIFGTVYKAFIIDYRMLFSLMFLEHSLELPDSDGNGDEYSETSSKKSGFMKRITIINSAGCFVGLICCVLQLSCLSNYVNDIDPGYGVHICPILAEVFVWICSVILLYKIRMINDEEMDEEKTYGLKMVLCCFGAVGLTCWVYEAALVSRWAVLSNEPNLYFNWLAAKLAFRFLTALLMIYCFMKINLETMRDEAAAKSQVNHFLVAILMFGMWAEFLGTAVDQYLGPIQDRFKKEVKKTSFAILLEAGPALYLAFCLHGGLHFGSILWEMRAKIKKRVVRDNQGTTEPNAETSDLTEATTLVHAGSSRHSAIQVHHESADHVTSQSPSTENAETSHSIETKAPRDNQGITA